MIIASSPTAKKQWSANLRPDDIMFLSLKKKQQILEELNNFCRLMISDLQNWHSQKMILT